MGLGALALWAAWSGCASPAASPAASPPPVVPNGDTGELTPFAYICPHGGDWPTITDALAATSGDVTLTLCPSWFTESLVIADRAVTLVSTAGGNTTWLDPQRAGPAITVTGGGTLQLSGVSIRNGEGAGVVADAAVVVEDGWFYDNDGPAIVADDVRVDGTNLHDNRGAAIVARTASVHASTVRGPGFSAGALTLDHVLWEGEGDLTDGDLTAAHLTAIQAGDAGSLGPSGEVLNAIVVGAWLPAAPALDWTDAWGSAQPLGASSFSADPRFQDLTTYALAADSPCVDAGSGADQDGSPADLGYLPR